MASQVSREAIQRTAKGLIEFINSSPSPFHVVEQCRSRLLASGFQEISEKNPWNLQKNKKYFLTRNKSTIIAFSIGGQFQSGNGFTMIGAHTDSPCLKVKPKSKRGKCGYLSIGVECYGGGIWGTWFDRDLTVAGRVILKKDEKLSSHLVHIKRPILRIPHLAIHLQRTMNDNFSANKETHLLPIIATSAQVELEKQCNGSGKGNSDTQANKHHPTLIKLICDDLSCSPEEIMDFELSLADTQPGVIGGALDEFIFAPRLDNLFNSYCALEALISSLNDTLEGDPNTRMAVLFDNEEVGSESAQGAASHLTELVLRRIVSSFGRSDQYEQSIANSFLLSADQAHAVHPNYVEKHEDNHQPLLHGGPVLKFNCNQRYATTSATASILRVIAESCKVPLQDVVVRNDSSCGSTIGPILSATLGIRTLDIGGPQLAMHSIREMCCTSSVHQTLALYKAFYLLLPSTLAASALD